MSLSCAVDIAHAALKLVGVGFCWLGNALTVLIDRDEGDSSDSPAHSFWGDVVCLVGAVLYAIYTVGLRWLAPPELSIFFGILGLFTFAVFGPVVALLGLTSLEALGGLTAGILGLIVVKGLLDNVLSEYLWANAVLLTSPAVATVGLSLTVRARTEHAPNTHQSHDYHVNVHV